MPFAAAVRASEATAEFLASVRPDLQADVNTSLARLFIDPGQEAAVEVTVDAIGLGLAEQRCLVCGGWVRLTSTSGPNDHSLSIPYAVIGCRIKGIPVLDYAFAYLSSATRKDVETARFWNQQLAKIEEGHVFKLHRDRPLFNATSPAKGRFASEILPVLQVQLQRDTRGIRAELLSVGGSNPVEIFPREVGSRMGGWGRVETVHLVWESRLPNRSFANTREYIVRICALRLFSGKRKEDEWRDEVISSMFRLEYDGQSIGDDSHRLGSSVEILSCF